MGTIETSKLETVSNERGCVCYAPLVPRKGVGKRIQRKRTAGWKMPKNTVYVGRPSKWGNPYQLTDDDTIDDILTDYREWLETMLIELPHIFDLNELKDKNLACWCALDKPCHADILLRMIYIERYDLQLKARGYDKSSDA